MRMIVATVTEGRICIPQDILDLIGVKPGDIVALISSPEGIVLRKIHHLKPVSSTSDFQDLNRSRQYGQYEP